MLSCGVFTFWFTEPKVNQKVVKFVAVYSDNYDETMQTKRTGLSSNSWCLSHPTGGASTTHLFAFGLDLPCSMLFGVSTVLYWVAEFDGRDRTLSETSCVRNVCTIPIPHVEARGAGEALTDLI